MRFALSSLSAVVRMRPLSLVAWTLALGLGVVQGAAGQESGAATFDPRFYEGLDYRMIGPHRGGRVTAVTGVVQEKRTFYMGATGGGLWRTTDLGKTWRNLSDRAFESPSIGAIDVADSDPNVIYVGTGSACIRSNVLSGRGVYGSIDRGGTWTLLGLREAGAIGDLVVHPMQPELVYVAALGHPFGPNPERGVFRSRDGGRSWEKVLFVSSRTGAVDLAMDPTNPRRIFAAMWEAERKPWTIKSGGEEGGLWLTKDGGDAWAKVEEGLPAGAVGKIAVEVSASNPQRVYALVEAPGDRRGLYRSEDGGESFAFVNGQKSLLYRPWYYTHLTVDPKNEDRVYVNNEDLWVSVDGGKTFESLETPHGDNHALWIHPDDPDLMVQGNDGGANVSWDRGRSWSPQWNQPTAELYQVAVDSRFPYRVYGAQQDNSTISVPSKVSRRPLDPKQDWLAVSGCETGPVVVHPGDPNVVYGGCKGRHSVYDFRTEQTREYWVYPHFNYGHDTADMPYRFQRVAPLIVSPHDSSVLYHASHVVHRSRDEGRTWTVVSPDLTANDARTQGYSGEPITRDITGEEVYSAIYALAESPIEKGVLWAGANDGPIHISRDGGERWTEITPPDLPPGGRVNFIEPSPHAPGRAYVAVYRFLLDDFSPYLYRTDDFGASWRRLTDGTNGIAPDDPVRVVREDPEREGLLYAGTDLGMKVSFDGGHRWRSLQLDLPVVPVTDIEIHRGDLVISTMGRSFWILDDITPLRQLSDEVARARAWLFEPRDAYRARWVGSLERLFPGYAPEYPPTGASVHYVLAEDAEELWLEIVDATGALLRTYRSGDESGGEGERAQPLPVSAGMHRFVWDLRHEGVEGLGEAHSRSDGPIAVPGRYRVRLSAVLSGGDEWSEERELELLIDPRVAQAGIGLDDLVAELDLSLEVRDAIAELRGTVRRIRSVREQVRSIVERTEIAEVLDRRTVEEIAALAEPLLDELDGIERALIQSDTGKVGLELEPQLDSQLTYLYGMLDGADQRPGGDAYLRYADVRAELDGLLGRLRSAEAEGLVAFNELLADRGVPAVLPVAVAGQPPAAR